MSRILIIQIIAGIAGSIIAAKKGRNYFLWFLLCFIFPVSVLVILLFPPVVAKGRTKRCPFCSRVIHENAPVCKYCKKELPIDLIQCHRCGSFVPEKEYCMNCNKKLKD
ncbi:MAG: hypothetical protein A2X59_10470 [Nitrospirae bacterium GWC2_42_7]|nr:MAG: hypothetical protein A2X59_10470 [Nitrospirae bacterium GWC2_42_7]